MLEEGRISTTQLGMAVVLTVIGTSILLEPSLTIGIARRDAWMSTILAGGIGALVMWTMMGLNRQFPGKTPIEYLRTLFGRLVGTILGAYLLIVIFRFYAVMLREFTDFTITVGAFRTPPEVILILILLIVYYGVRKGLEVLVRVAQFVMIIEVIQLLLSVLALASKDIQWGNFLPVFENGPIPVLRSCLVLSEWMGELILMGFLLPYIRFKSGMKKASYIGVGCITLLLTISNIYTLGVFGDIIGGRLEFGLYEVGRYISVADFLERLDPIVMGVWIMLMFCKLSIVCYCLSLGTAQLFGAKDYRPFVGIMCLGGAVMSGQIAEHPADIEAFILGPFPVYVFIVTVIAPLIILAVAWLRRRWGVVR